MLILIIPRAREVTLWVLGEQSTPAAPYDVPDNVIVNQAQSEGAAAYQDNLYVARWFAACSKFSAIEKMPPELVIWVQPFRVEWTSTSDAKIETPPGPQQFQVAELSHALYRQRVAGAASVHDTYAFAQWMQWIIIILGFLTTIVVTLSTSQEYGRGDGKGPRNLRFLAIALPVLGTAVAAVNAFYNPSQQFAAAKRTLAGLAQLHNQVATELPTLACTDPDGKIAQWVKRYQDIQSIEGASGQQQGSPGGSGSGAPTPPVKTGG